MSRDGDGWVRARPPSRPAVRRWGNATSRASPGRGPAPVRYEYTFPDEREVTHVYFVDMEMSKFLCQHMDFVYIGHEGRVNTYFLCRHRDCLYTCRSVDWLTTEDERGFYCPMCTRKYEPFANRPGLVSANRVCFMKAYNPAYLIGDAPILTTESGRLNYFMKPYWWAQDPVLQAVEHTWKVRAMGIDHPYIFSKPPWERMAEARKCFEDYCEHPLFEHRRPTKDIMNVLRQRNAMSGKKQPNGSLDLVRFEGKGSYGKFMEPWLNILEQPVSEPRIQLSWHMCRLSDRATRGLPTRDSDADGTTDPGTVESTIETQPECAMPEGSDSEHEC